MRVLGRIRLSRFSDESTSLERQRELIERWAKDNDHEIAGWAEDVDVSGSVDPFKTPELGPWLTTEKQHDWDILVAWKLDRIARNAIMMSKLFAFCYDNDKTLTTITDHIDLSTTNGRMIANIIAGIAEGELEAIKERTQASRKKLVATGRWTGGRPTYGYRAVKLDNGGWALEPDPESSAILYRIVDQVLAGASTLSLVKQLNEEKVYTPADFVRYRNGKPTKSGKWTTTTTLELLRSKTLIGHIVHNGQIVRDDSGQPVLGGPPLVPYEKFSRLQAALDNRSRKQTVDRIGASPLIGVAVCWDCGANLYHQRQVNRGKVYRYYKCLNRCTQNISADLLEERVEQDFLETCGDVEETQKVYIPGENHLIELEQASEAVDELSTLLGTVTSKTVRSRLTAQLTALDSTIQALEALPSSEARIEQRPTGRTYKQAWEAADTDGRRDLLVRAGITARAKVFGRPPGGRSPGSFYHGLVIPADIAERLSRTI